MDRELNSVWNESGRPGAGLETPWRYGIVFVPEVASMEQVTLAEAKEHLDDLMQRAARGEDVRIVDPELGTVRLTPVADVTSPRVTDAMPPLAKRTQKRQLGRLEGKMQVPDKLMEPMSEEELRDWYGPGA
jgi:antitoxin (DNA-binding transcriptional repressor) of toxin-antitoxin stability system